MAFTYIFRRIGQFLLLASCLGFGLVYAQSAPSLNDVYAAAQSGKLEQAQAMVQQVLVAHPNSAKAYYVRSELFARQGELSPARDALAAAEKLAPGLPFAKAEAVQALRAQLFATNLRSIPGKAAVPYAALPTRSAPTSWGWPLLLAGGVMVAGYFIFRRRPPEPMTPQPAYMRDGGIDPAASAVGSGPGMQPPGYVPAAGTGLGGRIMGGVATGLAVGAGVVAAEAIGRSLLGRQEPFAAPPAYGNNDYVNRNADMGGPNFGVSDAGSWDDAGIGDAVGGDWDN
jgi:hypothetical protein